MKRAFETGSTSQNVNNIQKTKTKQRTPTKTQKLNVKEVRYLVAHL